MVATRRLPRAERREQILAAATRAFAQGGFAGTGLDAIAAEAGITPVILYRHFASKADLYRAVLENGRERLRATVGSGETAIPSLLRAAAADPDAFRLLFRHAAREPEFRDVTDALRTNSIEIAEHQLAQRIPDQRWREWAARLLPALTTEAVIAWLDAGQPDPDRAAAHIARVVASVVESAGL
ncbi:MULTISPECIES: TetR/AcrR family transcriptional regulator [unclassified Nocardia]|uniref:TetR/AcrR family transcriptional regulator n=1 Tax=unclassified Nocardia TaxID=2637762 RepID=UPI001CE43D96|nr:MULTISPECIES: TetR/AcrR family transcriptional regulator [unclassified Nocardia]